MTEPRFHGVPQPLDLEALLALTGATLARGATARPLAITGVGALGWAGPADLAVLDDPAGADALAATDAGACLLPPSLADRASPHAVALVSAAPRAAFARVAAALFPSAARPRPLFGPGVAPGAVVHPHARLEPDVSVDPGAVIGPRAEIGRGAVIGANVVIGADVRLGRDGAVGPGASIEHALIGERATIHAGARIGFASGPESLGRVIVQDDVEIGANAAVARGLLRDTVIGEGGRIGALAAIGADAMIGRFSIAFAHTNLPGGVELPDYSTVTAQAGRDAAPRAKDRKR